MSLKVIQFNSCLNDCNSSFVFNWLLRHKVSWDKPEVEQSDRRSDGAGKCEACVSSNSKKGSPLKMSFL